RGGEARGAAASKPAVAPRAAPRETAGLLRGLQCLRQEGLCPRRARRADAARTDAKIVISGHVRLPECGKLSGNSALLRNASCRDIAQCLQDHWNSRVLQAPNRPPAPLVLYPAIDGRLPPALARTLSNARYLAPFRDEMRSGSFRLLLP